MKTPVTKITTQKVHHTGYKCCKCGGWKNPKEIMAVKEGAVCRYGCQGEVKQAAESLSPNLHPVAQK